MSNIGLYIHIPFCLSRCRYCGFYSNACGMLDAPDLVMDRYVEDILRKIRHYGKQYGRAANPAEGTSESRLVDTVFIGGGTPSILKEGKIARILDAVRESFDVAEAPAGQVGEISAPKLPEITIEANPKTLTPAKLREYISEGVSRISIGVQSLDKDVLLMLGRAHTADDFRRSYDMARDAGFRNINCDVMFGIPGQTVKQWMDPLEKLIDMGPDHISFYSLQIEEGTPMYDDYRAGRVPVIDTAVDREMYHRGIRLLKDAEYCHYEISNAARPGFECRHNLKYWDLSEYLGIGASASSYIDHTRFTEDASIKGCLPRDGQTDADGAEKRSKTQDKAALTYSEYHKNTLFDDASEYTFTGLRKTAGISLADFKARFGEDFWDIFSERRRDLEPFFEKGLLLLEDGSLRLSEFGIDCSNEIMACFV